MQWRVCQPDDKYIGLCNTHASVMRGEVCEATLIQRVRDALDGTEGITYYWPTDDIADRIPTSISIDVVRRALDGDGDD